MHAYVFTSFCVCVFGLLCRTFVVLMKEQIKPDELLSFLWTAGFAIWAGILLWA